MTAHPSALPTPAPTDLMRVVDLVWAARPNTFAGLIAREELIEVVADMVTEIGLLRDTVIARGEDLEELRARLERAEQARDDFARACRAEEQGGMARLATARSFRLASPSEAVDPAVHTPDRVAAYLTARGWQPRLKERNLWDHGSRETVHVHGVATASDYTARTGLLVSDLASIYGTGELQVLADIAEAGDE